MLIKYTIKKAGNQVFSRFSGKHVTIKGQKRICECGNWVEFAADEKVVKFKLKRSNFCGNRFCPMCAWRQTKKDAMKIGVMMDYIAQEHTKTFVFVTFTAPNVKEVDLSKIITQFNKAFKSLTKRKCVEKINRGYIRKLEITYNEKRDDYHPHFHCVFAVNASYFTDRTYIKQETWLNLWREVMGDESITQVDVRRVKKSDKGKDIGEFAKYAVKDSEYTKNQSVFDSFYKALKGRQVMTFNGLFAEANKKYKAKELDKYKPVDNTEYVYMLLYRWGLGEYVEKERRELTAEERSKVNRALVDEVDID